MPSIKNVTSPARLSFTQSSVTLIFQKDVVKIIRRQMPGAERFTLVRLDTNPHKFRLRPALLSERGAKLSPVFSEGGPAKNGSLRLQFPTQKNKEIPDFMKGLDHFGSSSFAVVDDRDALFLIQQGTLEPVKTFPWMQRKKKEKRFSRPVAIASFNQSSRGDKTKQQNVTSVSALSQHINNLLSELNAAKQELGSGAEFVIDKNTGKVSLQAIMSFGDDSNP